MSDYDPDELLTAEEIGDRCGVARLTVSGWRHRQLLPEPDERVGKRLLRWKWSSVEGTPIVRRALGRPQADGQ